MLLDIVLWVLFVFSVAGLVALVVRKLPVLKAIDLTQVNEVRLKEVKRVLVQGRLQRALARWLAATAEQLKPATEKIKRPFAALGKRTRAFEERAVQQLTKQAVAEHTPLQLLEQASAARAAGKPEAAERLLVELLRHDTRNLAAYASLAELYLGERDYEQAGEVFQFLVERTGSARAHLGAARVAAGQGNLPAAIAAYTKALEVEDAVAPRLEFARVLMEEGSLAAAFEQVAVARRLEPSNPKILDFYIELSIVNGRPLEAQSALDALREVNPDNQKIPELTQAVRQLAQKLKPKPKAANSRKSASFGVSLKGK